MSKKNKNIAVFASGNGSNLQALIDAEKREIFSGKIQLIFSNIATAYALERAKLHHIKSFCLESKTFQGTPNQFDAEILAVCVKEKIDLICLAGYLKILSSVLINQYFKRIINIHPSLLPKYGGKGFYGHFVHEAVIKNHEKESGATVHFVTLEPDQGSIILQKKIAVDVNDTPEILAQRVLKIEHEIYPEAVRLFCDDAV